MTRTKYQLDDVIGQWEIVGLLRLQGITIYYLRHQISGNKINCDEDTLTRLLGIMTTLPTDTYG
ncbi:MAG: hypothetical protein AAFQ41_03165 [Cyanobacteria bacterium J06623_7]